MVDMSRLSPRRLKHGLTWRSNHWRYLIRKSWRRQVERLLRIHVPLRWVMRFLEPQFRHGLSAPLVVSLTSYPVRFATLSLTLRSLLLQSVRPDHVILWVAEEHRGALPRDILALQAHGLTISFCDNELRSHNKYIHSFKLYPDAFIVTADDDTYYWRHWLRQLVSAYDPQERTIPCHRILRISLTGNGLPAPYRQWQWDSDERGASSLIFPTGVGGVLYPPHSLAPEVSDRERILALCPREDDAWLFWMAQRNGFQFKLAHRARRLVHWHGTQEHGLMWQNVYDGSGSDEQIKALIAAYGWPPETISEAARMASL